jgi:glycosidase
MDFVPNHSSDQHPWFLKSVAREEPYTDFYVWRDPKGFDEDGEPIPPNNWVLFTIYYFTISIKPNCCVYKLLKGWYFVHTIVTFSPPPPTLLFANEKIPNNVSGMRTDGLL